MEEGRRIYLHERSLAQLAQHSETNAEIVYRMIARMVLLKIVHHILEEDSVALGLIGKERAGAVSSCVQDTFAQDVSITLHNLGLKGKPPLDIIRLLDEAEAVAATCYFSGYLTFATSDKAAERMFSDTNEISEMLRIQRANEGYEDLLLVKGNRLQIMAPEGQNGSKKPGVLSRKASDQIKARVFGEVRSEFLEIVERTMPQPNPTEQEVVQKVDTLFKQALSKGAFATLLPW